MIDFLKLSLFLKDEYMTVCDKSGQRFLHYPTIGAWGFNVSAGRVYYDEVWFNGRKTYTKVTSNEQCPWDKIESSYSGMAMKWWDSNSFTSVPRLEIKASPAKLEQGHNVFGSTDIEKGALFMINVLLQQYPQLRDAIDWKKTTLDLIDVTYSAKLDPKYHLQMIQWLRNISNGQMRKSSASDEYETTVYWGKGSKRKVLKAYLKHTEMQREIEKLKREFEKNPFAQGAKERLDIMRDERLQEFAKPLLRFESRLKKDWFRSNIKAGRLPRELSSGSLNNWIKYQKEVEARGECLILNLWLASFDSLFDALNGEAINMQNEEQIHNQLKAVYFRETKTGISYTKADKLFGFYMRLVNEGYDNVYRTYARNTFGRLMRDLLDATGLSKGQLQNLHAAKDTNIIPFCKLINIEFNNQVPQWAA